MKRNRPVARTDRRPWLVLAVAVVAAVASVPGARASANAQAGGVIDLDLDAAPDVEGLVEVRLVSEGDDVTDSYCRPADPGVGADLRCSGLPAASYDVEAVGVPDGLRTTVNCTDAVASRALPPVAADPASPWTCVAFVGSPAVSLTVNSSFGGPVLEAGSLELAPVDGVTPACVDDEVNNSPARRCRDLPLGTYDVEVTDVPETAVVGTPLCQARLFGGDGLDLPVGPAAMLTDERWLWWCDVSVEPPAVIGLAFSGGEQPEPVGAGLRVIGPGGDVTSRCASFGSGDEPGRWYWSCDLDVGSYNVTFTGVRAEDVVDACETVDVTIGQSAPLRCLWTVRPRSGAPTTSVTRPASPGMLPATGNSTSLAFWLAMGAMIGGSLLVVATRRTTDPEDFGG